MFKNFLKENSEIALGCHGFNSLIGCHGFNSLTKIQPDCFELKMDNFRGKHPFVVEFELTHSCSAARKFGRCAFCYSDSGRKLSNELTQKQKIATIQELGKIGINSLVLGGGEPIDIGIENLSQLIFSAKGYSIDVFLSTSGIGWNKEFAKQVLDAGLDSISISLDGSTPAIHSMSRGNEVAWLHAINTIEFCLEAGLKVGITTVVSKHNFNDFNDTIFLAQKFGVKEIYTIPLMRTGRAWNHPSAFLLPQEKAAHILRVMEANKKYDDIEIEVSSPQKSIIKSPEIFGENDSYSGCTAGIYDIGILPDGTIVDCPIHRYKIGDVRDLFEQKFIDKWHKGTALMNRKNLKGKCLSCKYTNICGGCRAEAFAEFKDHFAEEPNCVFFASR